MDKHSQKECRALIQEKELKLYIKKIAQTYRLFPEAPKGTTVVSRPILSWNKLYAELLAMPTQVKPVVAEEKSDEV